jgi:hypothetical protein
MLDFVPGKPNVQFFVSESPFRLCGESMMPLLMILSSPIVGLWAIGSAASSRLAILAAWQVRPFLR